MTPRNLRESLGLTQRQIGQEMGITGSAVSRFEKKIEHRQNVKISTLIRYATALGGKLIIEFTDKEGKKELVSL